MQLIASGGLSSNFFDVSSIVGREPPVETTTPAVNHPPWEADILRMGQFFEGKSLCVEFYQHRKSSSCAKLVVLWRFLMPFVVSATILLARDLQNVLKNLFCGGASVCRSRMGS